jgi:alanyl-tRNA synthetase
VKNKQNIKKIIKAEEESFNTTLDRGITLFDAIAEEVANFDLNSIIDELKKMQKQVNDLMDVELKEKLNKLIDQRENLTNENALSEIDYILAHPSEDKLSKLTSELAKLRKKHQKYITGEDIFKLYDTFGFPDDLLNVMAQEKGLKLDVERFQQLMNEQKDRARSSTKKKLADIAVQVSTLNGFDISDDAPTAFVGYDQLIIGSEIVGVKEQDDLSMLIFNRTPFYVEAGGQIDDVGVFAVADKIFEIIDVTKVDNRVVHIIKNQEHFQFQIGMEGILSISETRRWDIMRNHSATHFLHAALRKTLGTHVQQAGSYVGPDRLRFDFTHFSKLTQDEFQSIENIVNEQIRKNITLQHHRSIPFDEAKKMGALMFFGDKYGDSVNVVQFGDYTLEFCGGTHVHNSSEIGLFKIISESSIASGVRRIEAVTGAGVEKYIHLQQEHLKSFEQKIEELLDGKKKLEKEIAELKTKEKLEQLDHILSLSSEEKGIKIYKGKVHSENMDELKSFGDEMRNRMGSGVGVLIAQIEDKVGIVAVVSDDIIKQKKLSAGKIVGELAKLVGGGGGGRPHLATAGGKDIAQIVTALSKVEKIVITSVG